MLFLHKLADWQTEREGRDKFLFECQRMSNSFFVGETWPIFFFNVSDARGYILKKKRSCITIAVIWPSGSQI